MPWAKYPGTETWVRIINWWREEEANFPNGRDYVEFDEEHPRVAIDDVGQIRDDPKFEVGDKVYALGAVVRKPDPTRFNGIIDAIYFAGTRKQGSVSYDVIWPIHSLAASDNVHKETRYEHTMSKMDSTPRISAPRFLIGEFVNVQGLNVILRQNKVLSYAFWEAPPEDNWSKGDRGWWVNVEFTTGAGQAAERKLWNSKHAPFTKQTIRDNPHGLTVIMGSDQDSVFIISNEDWANHETPIYQGKVSEGLVVEDLKITDYDRAMIGRMGSQQPISQTGGLTGDNPQSEVAPIGGWRNIFSGRRELAPNELGYRDDGNMFELDPFKDMADESSAWKPGDRAIELGAIKDLQEGGVEPRGTVPVETGPGAGKVIEPKGVGQIDPAPTGGTPQKITRVGVRFRGRGNPKPKWNDPEKPFQIGKEAADSERTGLLEGTEAGELGEVELGILRDGIAAEVGEGGLAALQEGQALGQIAQGAGSFFSGD